MTTKTSCVLCGEEPRKSAWHYTCERCTPMVKVAEDSTRILEGTIQTLCDWANRNGQASTARDLLAISRSVRDVRVSLSTVWSLAANGEIPDGLREQPASELEAVAACRVEGICPRCMGGGELSAHGSGTDPCPDCDGTGDYREPSEIACPGCGEVYSRGTQDHAVLAKGVGVFCSTCVSGMINRAFTSTPPPEEPEDIVFQRVEPDLNEPDPDREPEPKPPRTLRSLTEAMAQFGWRIYAPDSPRFGAVSKSRVLREAHNFSPPLRRTAFRLAKKHGRITIHVDVREEGREDHNRGRHVEYRVCLGFLSWDNGLKFQTVVDNPEHWPLLDLLCPLHYPMPAPHFDALKSKAETPQEYADLLMRWGQEEDR